jgi:hypothetical protein
MRELVSDAFVTGWTAARPDVTFALENEGASLPPDNAAFFAYLTIVPTTSSQMTQGRSGTRRVRRDGWIQVKLWGPPGTGSSGLSGLVGTARDVLEMVSIPPSAPGSDEPVTTYGASTLEIDDDGRWFTMLVRIPFWYAETK